MNAAALPLRLIPKRKPHPAHSLSILFGSLLICLTIRYLTFGLQMGQGVVATIFPALMFITLYAGMGYGLAAVALVAAFVVEIVVVNQGATPAFSVIIGLSIFVASALITVGLAGALREVLLQLDEYRMAREAAEAQRQESEGRFRVMADSAPVMMWVTRPDRHREFVNRAYREFLGIGPTDPLGANMWVDRLHPEDRERLLAGRQEGESHDKPFSIEGRFRRADGQWRWLHCIYRPRHSARGEFEGFVGAAFDVTETKAVEADLAEKVEAAVAERDEAQIALMQSQKLEALGQLTGGVAHDFNNLLTVVIGALDIILRKPTDERRRERLGEAALAAARRGERLTQQLLAFSRRQPLKPEVLAIDHLLHESEPLLRRAVGEGFHLTFDLHANGTLARIDGGQFEAAVLNLLINARDATPDTGHIVIASAVADLPAQNDLPAGRYVKVTITDDGAGMDEATAARCFEPFFTTKPVGKGTGLGLSQVYGFARQSDGSATVISQVGAGTAISLLLPVTEQPAEAPAVHVPASGDFVLKVLLVEDDADVGDLVEAMLAELGHSVIRAANVEQALRVCTSETCIGLLLTDVIMPGGRTGVDLAQEVARLRPGLPIILSSGYTGATLAEADRAPWPLLRKPYTLDALKTAIAQAMEPRPVQVA